MTMEIFLLDSIVTDEMADGGTTATPAPALRPKSLRRRPRPAKSPGRNRRILRLRTW